MNNELLKQCKDEVAKAKNFIDWPDMCAHDHYTNLEHASDKVAELYSSRQREETLEAYNRECKRVDELTTERDHWLETAKSHGTKIRELEGLLKEDYIGFTSLWNQMPENIIAQIGRNRIKKALKL